MNTGGEEKKPSVFPIVAVPTVIDTDAHPAAVSLVSGEFHGEHLRVLADGNCLMLDFRHTKFRMQLDHLVLLWVKAILEHPECPKKTNLILPSG